MREKRENPAFLFYPTDASNDTQFMNRLERGAYFDLLKVQKIFRGFTTAQLKKILGKDYKKVWPALELVLAKDEDGYYYIPWVRVSIEKKESYSLKQRERIEKRWYSYEMTDKEKETEKTNDKTIDKGKKIEKYRELYQEVVSKYGLDIPEGFEAIIMEWLKYKSEKGQSYKMTGLKNFLLKFLQDTQGDIECAREMVEYSTSNNYSGLFKKPKNGNDSENIKRRIQRVNKLWNH